MSDDDDPDPAPLPDRQMVFGVPDLARYLDVHPQTVRRLRTCDPEIGAIMRRVGGQWVAARADLYGLARRRDLPWPPESLNGHHDAR